VLFSLPVAVLVSVLLLYPIGETLYYSFTTWDGVTATWIGSKAYTNLLSSPDFKTVLENNALILLSIPVAIVLPLGVAFLLSGHIRGWRVFRSIFFLPTAISWVVIGFVSTRFFADEGILQGLLGDIGLGSLHPDMLSNEHRALFAVMITFVWSMFGTNMIVFLAGMATIDPSLYDAAKVDGASAFKVLTRITVPLLRRFVQFSFVITVVTAFTALFSLIYVMTGGGPGYGTTTLEFYIYQEAFSSGDFGTAATAGSILFVVVAIVSAIQLLLLRGGNDV
jgi:ABC-type sugar transport system permease subunit